jgi:Tol biopolymer transport system component
MLRRLSVFSLTVIVSSGLCAAPAVAAPRTARVLVEASGTSHAPAVSTDGRFVAFLSEADNLLGGDPSADPNGVADVFLVDTTLGTIRSVSDDAATGDPADGPALGVDISGDGRWVAFSSAATNLVPGDLNDASDVFLYDALNDSLQLVSRKGVAGAQGNRGSNTPSISKDGTRVAFTSAATNLVANDTNNRTDVFVRNVSAGTTTRASTDSNGKQANGDSFQAKISPNGSVVAFSSNAINLVKADSSRTRDVFVKVLGTGKTSIVSVRSDEQLGSNDSSLSDVSGSGRYVVMQSYSALVKGDTNNTGDVFMRDRTDGTTIRVSRDGSTQSNDQSFSGAISDDGARIAFQTWATNLGPGPDGNGVLTDVLELTVAGGDLARLSADAEGGWSDAASYDTTISGDGLVACFATGSTDMVAGDTNGQDDVFCHAWTDETRTASTTVRWSVAMPEG